MKQLRSSLVAVAGILVLAGCQGQSPVVDQALARDLERIQGSALELAPSGTGTQVISAIEQSEAVAPVAMPARDRARTPERRLAAAPRAPRAVRAARATPEPRPQQAAPAPEPVAEEQEAEFVAPAPRPTAPSSAPLGAGPAPPGGWRSVDEVIRNSRIPIKP